MSMQLNSMSYDLTVSAETARAAAQECMWFDLHRVSTLGLVAFSVTSQSWCYVAYFNDVTAADGDKERIKRSALEVLATLMVRTPALREAYAQPWLLLTLTDGTVRWVNGRVLQALGLGLIRDRSGLPIFPA